MLGLIIFILAAVRIVLNNMQEQVNFIVEFKPETTSAQLQTFKNLLESKPYYKADSYHLISKEEALKLMREDIGQDLERTGIDNPFYDMVTFNIKSIHITRDNVQIIETDILKADIVQHIHTQEFMLESIVQNINKTLIIGSIVGLLFFLLALYSLHSTMKLWLFIRRFSVRIMQLVGATPQFICKPFIRQSAIAGLLGATIAVVFLMVFYFILLKFVPNLKSSDFILVFIGILLFIYLIGALITGLSARIIINRYLRYKTEELY